MTRTEAQTRSELIDNLLSQAGWNVKDPTQVIEEFDILISLPVDTVEPPTTFEGHQFSDYVLLGKNGKPLAVVEAKKTCKDAALGREQAKQYCYNLQKQLGCELPFCFYSNGHEIYFWDLENYPPRKIVRFPTRDDFERFQYIRRNRKPLTQELINPSIAGRDYQIRAIRAVLEGIEQKRRGTRLLETSKPKLWCTEKEVFLILGCWDNFEYFKLNPKGKELKPQVPLPVRLARLSQEKERAETLKEAIVEKISELPLTINMNHDSHGKGKQDHFHCVTKMILKFNPIEFGGFMRAGR